MNQAQDSNSSDIDENLEECNLQTFTFLVFDNPQKRKQYDSMKLYQQQKELFKMSGFSKQFVFEQPPMIKDDGIQKNYATESLCCLTVTNPFRERIIRIVLNPWFDRFILVIILSNCVFLAIDDPNVPAFEYQIIADLIFLAVFTIEMMFKIIAMGFAFKPFSYLRDTWNVVILSYFKLIQLDFIVVIMGWVSQFAETNNVSAIRVIRILRPLRTINSIPSMRKLVASILNSLPTMLDVLVLFLFFLVMFGTVATQLFGGLLSNRCIDSKGNLQLDFDENSVFCQSASDCQTGYNCIYYGNPDSGVSCFDNILVSDLNIFVIITMEGWSSLMYYIRHATGTVAYDIYFVLVVIFGSFFIVNLLVAVQFSYLSQSFSEQKDQRRKQMIQEKIDKKNKEIAEQKNKQQKDQHQSQNQLEWPENFADAINAQQPNINDDSQDNHKQKRCKNLRKRCSIKKSERFIIFQDKVKWLIEHRVFNIIIMILILVNILFMALVYQDMPATLSQACNLGNQILTCVFAGEMVLKLIGLGIKGYLMDGFNDFDAIIVVIGMLEFASIGNKAILVFRAFRLLRIFKIVRAWTGLRKLLQTVLASLKSIANLGLLMCLLSFIYILIGMQFLSGEVNGSDYRYAFNSFGQSIITIFILLTAENWNYILQIYIAKDGWGASIYFVTLIIFGNIMLLNLFLAILLNYISDNLDNEQLEQKEEDESFVTDQSLEDQFNQIQNKLKAQKEKQQSALNLSQINQGTNRRVPFERNDNNISTNMHHNAIEVESANPQKLSEGQANQQDDNTAQEIQVKLQLDQDLPREFQLNNKNSSNDGFNTDQREKDENKSEEPQSPSKRFKLKNKGSTVLNIKGRSLLLLGQDNKFRKSLKSMLENPYFENFIFCLIGINSVLLTIDQPFITDPYAKNTTNLLTNIISGIFIVEAILKILVLGFVVGKETYLRDPWNILDFVIVGFSILNWILDSFSDINVTFLRGFRALRALRPLRMVSKNEGLKLVVNSLLRAIPALFNVVLINLLFLLVFGILGVQLFQGTMGQCSDQSIFLKGDCSGKYTDSDGHVQDRMWIIPFNNYDNLIFSAITFFEVSNLEGWPDILFSLIDGSGVDQGPIPDSRPWAAAVLIIYIFITTFFVMNLFISVIVDKFNDELRKKEGSNNFTPEEKEWVKMQRIMLHINLKIRPTPPKNKCRKIFYKMVLNNKFEILIQIVIGLNTVFLCMDYVNQTATYAQILDIGNKTFVGIFAVEAICKIIAHGPKFYFLENWNKFDFTILALSLIALDESIFSFKVTVLRIIRAARLLRMIKTSKGLKNLLKALWLSLSSLGNIGMILFLVFFSFSVAGMDLFGSIVTGNFVSSDANFTTFYLSFMTLFRCATGENWNGIMHDCYNQGAGAIAIIYWVAFELVAHYIFLNVFIAVIYENFVGVQEGEHDADVLTLNRKDIKNFIKAWSIFCPNGEHYMKTSSFPAFLTVLPPPLGYGGMNIESGKLNKIIQCMNIKNHKLDDGLGGRVYFPEVMWIIFHSICGTNDEKVNECEEVQNIMKQLKYKYKGLGKNLTPERLCGLRYYKRDLTVSKYLCAQQIYKNWRNAREKRLQNHLKNGSEGAIDQAKAQNAQPVFNTNIDQDQSNDNFFIQLKRHSIIQDRQLIQQSLRKFSDTDASGRNLKQEIERKSEEQKNNDRELPESHSYASDDEQSQNDKESEQAIEDTSYQNQKYQNMSKSEELKDQEEEEEEKKNDENQQSPIDNNEVQLSRKSSDGNEESSFSEYFDSERQKQNLEKLEINLHLDKQVNFSNMKGASRKKDKFEEFKDKIDY